MSPRFLKMIVAKTRDTGWILIFAWTPHHPADLYIVIKIVIVETLARATDDVQVQI